MPQITVIVPVYKVEKYLEKCVESIRSQSFGDFDLVLVDDGSPDACPQMCDSFAEKDDRIVVIHKQNGGLSDARNAGIDWAMEHSDSQWLAFVDSDDYLHPDYLKTLFETAQKESSDLVICDFVRVNDMEEVVEKEHSFPTLVTDDKRKMFEHLNTGWRIDMAWNKLYAKSIFNHLRFAYGKIHEDEFAIHHVLWNCRKAAIIDSVLYFYRVRENSIMASESPKSRLDEMEALIEQFEFSVKHHLRPRDVVTSRPYLYEVMDLKDCLGNQELKRYHDLKKRFKMIYFSRKTNRKPKSVILFYFNNTCRKVTALYRSLLEKDSDCEE